MIVSYTPILEISHSRKYYDHQADQSNNRDIRQCKN